MQNVNWIALIVFALLFGFITWLGFAAAHWRRGDLDQLHEWGLGGRRFAGDARAAALDLSLADGRFAPDVLEVTARRAVTAWAEAVDGDVSRLTSIAHGQAVRDLLHPGDPSQRTRLVVRGPQVQKIRITGLDAGAQPPTMTIEVQLQGRRYIEDRDTTAVLAGSASHQTKFTEHWTFALDGDSRQPWLLAGVGAPVQLA